VGGGGRVKNKYLKIINICAVDSKSCPHYQEGKCLLNEWGYCSFNKKVNIKKKRLENAH